MYSNPLIQRLFLSPTNHWFIQLFRYCFVGGFAFLVDYGLLVLFTEVFGLHYLVSATISFIAGLIVNYFLSICWVFRKSKLKKKWAEFIVFSIIGIVGLILNNLFLYVLTDPLHVHYMISKLITTALVMVWNFGARKIILFNKK